MARQRLSPEFTAAHGARRVWPGGEGPREAPARESRVSAGETRRGAFLKQLRDPPENSRLPWEGLGFFPPLPSTASVFWPDLGLLRGFRGLNLETA